MNVMELDHDQSSLTDVEMARALFEGKWRFDIIRCLCDKPCRLSDLMRQIPSASKKMLIDTLHGLESLSWVVRRGINADTKHVDYVLSDEWSKQLRCAVRRIMNVS